MICANTNEDNITAITNIRSVFEAVIAVTASEYIPQ
jgi:hypothetical protein